MILLLEIGSILTIRGEQTNHITDRRNFVMAVPTLRKGVLELEEPTRKYLFTFGTSFLIFIGLMYISLSTFQIINIVSPRIYIHSLYPLSRSYFLI